MASSLSNLSLVTNTPGGVAATAPSTAAAAPVAPTAVPAEPAAPPAPAVAAAPMMGVATAPLPAGPPPGYASMRVPQTPSFPPAFGSAPPPPSTAAPRAGRLRIRNQDGSENARPVSPTGRAPGNASTEWLTEFNLGTISHQNMLYRIIPDRYLEGSFAMN